MPNIANFGGNLRFKPQYYYAPTTESEVLSILNQHANGKVRVVGAKHAWSPGIVSDDALIDLRHFNSIEIHDNSVTVGGGCRIKRLLDHLDRHSKLTLPSIGLITEQAVAGAISTATHGSGKSSLSHNVEELRVAAYDESGKARIFTWNSGPELQAARCALGCMGVILSVKFRCVPRYDVEEIVEPCDTLEDVLARENDYPLQQFYLLPFRWTYVAQRRRRRDPAPRTLKAKLYRVWWLLSIDLGLHLLIKFLACVMKSRSLLQLFYRRVLLNTVITNVKFIDRAEKMLTMKHELFKHLELELFVATSELSNATGYVKMVVEVADGAEPTAELLAQIDVINMRDELLKLRGTFSHHYPITFRRVLPDDTLISMTAGVTEPWYAISFITYVEPRDAFYAMADFLAVSMAKLFNARPHWGKYFPLGAVEVVKLYPQLPVFRTECQRVDSQKVFHNEFIQRVVFNA